MINGFSIAVTFSLENWWLFLLGFFLLNVFQTNPEWSRVFMISSWPIHRPYMIPTKSSKISYISVVAILCSKTMQIWPVSIEIIKNQKLSRWNEWKSQKLLSYDMVCFQKNTENFEQRGCYGTRAGAQNLVVTSRGTLGLPYSFSPRTTGGKFPKILKRILNIQITRSSMLAS